MRKLTMLAFACAPLVAFAEPAPTPRMVPAWTLTQAQVAHPSPRLPGDWIQKHPGVDRVQGLYKVCLNEDGRVAAVSPISGIDGADGVLMSQIAGGWVYQSQPQPVCFSSLVKFQIQDPPIRLGMSPPIINRDGSQPRPIR